MAEHPETDPLAVLSASEREIAGFLADGLSVSEISKRLSLSYHQVAETSKQIKRLLNVSTIAEMRNLISSR